MYLFLTCVTKTNVRKWRPFSSFSQPLPRGDSTSARCAPNFYSAESAKQKQPRVLRFLKETALKADCLGQTASPQDVGTLWILTQLQATSGNFANEVQKSPKRHRCRVHRPPRTKRLISDVRADFLPGTALRRPEPFRGWNKTQEPVRKNRKHLQSQEETSDFQRRQL